VYVERFGSTKDEIFVTASSLRKELGNQEFEKLPPGAIGLYTYYERLAQGLRQLMAGVRKFTTEHISRNDLAALTRESAEISGIDYIMDVDQKEAAKLLRDASKKTNKKGKRKSGGNSKPATRKRARAR